MRSRKAIFLTSIVAMFSLSANAATPQIEGQWTTTYQIIDVSNSTDTNPFHQRALKMWIGHKYGAKNCVSGGDASNLLRSSYPWDARVKPSVKFNEYGAFTATNRYWGGFAFPGHGTETIVGLIRGDHINGIVDIDLDWEGETHVRAVLTAIRSGPCSN